MYAAAAIVLVFEISAAAARSKPASSAIWISGRSYACSALIIADRIAIGCAVDGNPSKWRRMSRCRAAFSVSRVRKRSRWSGSGSSPKISSSAVSMKLDRAARSSIGTPR